MMRPLLVSALTFAVTLFSVDVGRGYWFGAFLWLASTCCIAWVFVLLDREPPRRRTDDHRRQ